MRAGYAQLSRVRVPYPGRLQIERLVDFRAADTLADDVLRGLGARPKWLPPKHLYDDVGAALFDQICELPEYYPTRTERALLAEFAPAIVEAARPSQLVELGSGSAHKTRLLLDSMGRLGLPEQTCWLVDVNEPQLADTGRALLEEYRWLTVRGLVADFVQPLRGLPTGPGVLLAILGGTIGNFEPEEAHALLSGLARSLGPGAKALIGTDMVKDPWRLAAAYDDSQGVTARFNLNVLRVINRRLRADFDPGQFEHVAYYDRRLQQIEMHLRARRRQRVRVQAVGLEVEFEPGETLRTEISRKFTPESGERMFRDAGFVLVRRFAPANGDFSLWLLEVA